jgi:hypothetical protein
MTGSKAHGCIGLAVLAAVAGSAPAAAQDYPFAITVNSGRDKVTVQCFGPSFRDSGCLEVPGNGKRTEFYGAESGIFSPIGKWFCQVRTACAFARDLGTVDFCGPGVQGAPTNVELVLLNDGGTKLTSNQSPSCFGVGTLAKSVLGQTGEADDTPAQDIDTYRFAGEAGEKIEVSLERDGSSGSLGAVATLRLRARGGAMLGEATGPVPLRLKATLPDEVEVIVLRDGKTGNALRGGYVIELKPVSGELGGRTLRPSENVEG